MNVLKLNESIYKIHNKLEDERDNAKFNLSRKYAFKYLKFYNKLLSKHKTHNHVIVIIEGMGYVGIQIDGTYLSDYSYHNTPLLKLLAWIEQSLDSSWAYHLGDVKLNYTNGIAEAVSIKNLNTKMIAEGLGIPLAKHPIACTCRRVQFDTKSLLAVCNLEFEAIAVLKDLNLKAIYTCNFIDDTKNNIKSLNVRGVW